jgi:hypothetical protein
VAAIRRVRAFEKLKGSAGVGGATADHSDWKPVVIGNPSGKMRRMNLLEMGKWSRWSEIRRLNLLEEDETRAD